MRVRIFQPAKTTMQSGRSKARGWQIEPELESPRRPEPLMGWTAADDTLNQIRLRFDSKGEAIAFAERRGWTYTIEDAHVRRVTPKNYADNFRRDRVRTW